MQKYTTYLGNRLVLHDFGLAEFLRLVIESHIEFYDEIVAVYNDCTDNTEAILLDLQKQYPTMRKWL